MTQLARRLRWSSLMALATLLGGCFVDAVPTPTMIPADALWETLAPGLERRLYRPGGEYPLTVFTALRVDPALFTFRVHYQPGVTRRTDDWRTALPDAAAFVNANFFDGQGQALGLVVSDGIPQGWAYVGMGGMLQVQNGIVRVRSTIAEPYQGEALEQAAQAFPMLVTDGEPSFEARRADRASRRTVVAQDGQGRVIFLVSSSLFGMPLAALSSYLVATDLELVNAVNLDGGGSSMMVIAGEAPTVVPSFDAVPVVIAVYPR